MKDQPPLPASAATTPGPTAGTRSPPPQVGAAAMWFGILGAPVAWSLQQLVNAPLLAHGCFPKDVPIAEPIWPHASSVALVVELVAVLVCIGAGLAAWRTWRRSRAAPKGRGPQPIEPHDGRVRYMAAVGLICSGLFLFSTLFTVALLLMVRPCNG